MVALILCTRKLCLREVSQIYWGNTAHTSQNSKPSYVWYESLNSSPLPSPSLNREHWNCLWESHEEIPWKAGALFYDKGNITAVVVTEQPSYAWQQPMKTRPLKGRLMPSSPFNSDLHLLIQLAFHVPVGKIQPLERETHAVFMSLLKVSRPSNHTGWNWIWNPVSWLLLRSH